MYRHGTCIVPPMRPSNLLLAVFLALGLSGIAVAETKKAKEKGSASAGRSAPAAPEAQSAIPSPDRDAAFKLADIDGDGLVSMAEAAGNERLVLGFDRSDRNR